MLTQMPDKPYSGNLAEDCAAAMDAQPPVLINCPGHQYHGREATFIRNLVGDQKAMLHVEDHIHVAMPLNCIVVVPRAQVQL